VTPIGLGRRGRDQELKIANELMGSTNDLQALLLSSSPSHRLPTEQPGPATERVSIDWQCRAFAHGKPGGDMYSP